MQYQIPYKNLLNISLSITEFLKYLFKYIHFIFLKYFTDIYRGFNSETYLFLL